MTEIGHDESQRLDVIPVQYRVIVTRRPKFACRACEGVVVQEPAPARLIEGGIPTEALVANVMVSRFADHQLLYRQAQIMARQGVLIDRATLAFWVGYGAAEIAPVVRRLKEIVLSSTRIFADETTMKVLDPGRGHTKQGYFWVAARDDRACGGADPPAVIYQYATGRAKRHADALLGGYRGIVQCDGYNAYKQLARPARDDLLHRSADPPRQRLAPGKNRRTHALMLETDSHSLTKRSKPKSQGRRASLTANFTAK
jgi:transposase